MATADMLAYHECIPLDEFGEHMFWDPLPVPVKDLLSDLEPQSLFLLPWYRLQIPTLLTAKHPCNALRPPST